MFLTFKNFACSKWITILLTFPQIQRKWNILGKKSDWATLRHFWKPCVFSLLISLLLRKQIPEWNLNSIKCADFTSIRKRKHYESFALWETWASLGIYFIVMSVWQKEKDKKELWQRGLITLPAWSVGSQDNLVTNTVKDLLVKGPGLVGPHKGRAGWWQMAWAKYRESGKLKALRLSG